MAGADLAGADLQRRLAAGADWLAQTGMAQTAGSRETGMAQTWLAQTWHREQTWQPEKLAADATEHAEAVSSSK